MLLIVDLRRQTDARVPSRGDIDSEMPQDAIHKICGPQVRRITHVVRAVGVLQQPLALVGRVVQHEVSQRQHLPVVSHLLHEHADIVERVRPQHRAEVRVELALVLQTVARVGESELLQQYNAIQYNTILLFGRSCVIVGHHRLTDELFPLPAIFCSPYAL